MVIRTGGLGTSMIQNLLDIARKKELKKVYLLVNVDNNRMLQVHKKCGFRIEAKLEEDHSRRRLKNDYRMAIFPKLMATIASNGLIYLGY